ncbi:MAG: TldD/PmbA family protein [Candidatus Bathyarchaeota archaeon]|nr:TldD/PmbA family protein [Candidatus Bathyarchaeota archaeon]
MTSDENWQFLTNTVHKVMKALEMKNVTHAEAFFASKEIIEVTIRNSEIFTQNKINDSGVGFRIAISGKVGFACTNTMNEKVISKAAEKALDIAKVSSEVPHFALPDTGKAPNVKGLFDARVAEMDQEEAISIAKRAISAAEDFDKRVIAKDGRVLFESDRVGVINTLSVDFEERGTRAVIYLVGGGDQDGEVTSSCYDAKFSRVANLKPEAIGENVARKVIQLFGPKPVKSFEGTVIFGPEAVSYQIVDVLVDALKGDNALSGRSVWIKDVGQNIGSQPLTVSDNAILENGFGSRSFDDEGYPSQNSVLIKDGELKGFLYDATTANAFQKRNTGNASRSPRGFELVNMIIGTSYRTTPQISISNMMMHSGSKTKEQLISETKKGVLVESMAGFPQEGSGMVSAQLSQAFFILDGEIKHPIKNGMVTGVVFDWLKHITAMGNDSKQFQDAVVPSLKVEEVRVVGA